MTVASIWKTTYYIQKNLTEIEILYLQSGTLKEIK